MELFIIGLIVVVAAFSFIFGSRATSAFIAKRDELQYKILSIPLKMNFSENNNRLPTKDVLKAFPVSVTAVCLALLDSNNTDLMNQAWYHLRQAEAMQTDRGFLIQISNNVYVLTH